MSKTFTPHSVTKTNRQMQSDNLSRRGRGRGTSTDNSTQTNRGRGRTVGSTTPNTRGRGGGTLTNSNSTATPSARPRISNHRMDNFQYPGDDTASSPQQSGPSQETENQQGTYVGAFTKFEPNTKKRQQVSEMARKETEQYERYKQQNAMKYCNYVGTTGGGETTEDMVRKKQATDVRNQKFNRLQNQQKRREERRESEQREIDMKRAEARRKADENAQRDRTPKPEDVRRKREQFLRQLECQSMEANVTSLQNVSILSPPRRTAAKPPSQLPTQPPRTVEMNRLSHPQPDSTTTTTTAGRRRNWDEEDKKFPVEDFPEEVMTLAAMLPDVDMTYLNSLYQDAGSVEAVLDILGV